jgi:glycosyltransferase involved in cell wall biosynthesis
MTPRRMSESTTATVSSPRDVRLAALRRIAIVPALNEEESLGRVIAEIRAADPDFDIVVIDDGSVDRTAQVAAAAGAAVVRLPFNIGIGGAVQTGLQYAYSRGFDVAVQIDGDGQHDAREIPKLLGPVVADEADIVIGSRFAGERTYRAPPGRRLGMRVFATVVSLLVGQPLTDTSSSFRAFRRRAIAYFALDYPHGFLETVEATVIGVRCGLRVAEVPVVMRERASGRSSLTLPLSIYYAAKVLVAVFVGLFRRNAYDLKED